MIIDKSQLAGQKSETEALIDQLALIGDETSEGPVLKIGDLLGDTPLNWDEIKHRFRSGFRDFETLLFKLHLKRKSTLSTLHRDRVISFLTIGYLHTNDVRYFNEFLHFYRETDQNRAYGQLMLQHFYKQLTPENHHTFLTANRQEVETFLLDAQKSMEQTKRKPLSTAFRLGLLGSPIFLNKIRAHFVSKGFDIRTYFIPFHTVRSINFLLKNRFTFGLACLLQGVNFRFARLAFDLKDPQIGAILKTEKLDIGFYHLGFIVKKNIIAPFKIGIVNDHYGVLPYIRGRSAIEYALLFGFPVAATAHVVTEGVNSGDIISIYRYDRVLQQYSTIKQIRKHIRREGKFRAIDAIEMLSRAKKPMIPNLAEKGLRFYSMHPLLEQFVEKQILNR